MLPKTIRAKDTQTDCARPDGEVDAFNDGLFNQRQNTEKKHVCITGLANTNTKQNMFSTTRDNQQHMFNDQLPMLPIGR